MIDQQFILNVVGNSAIAITIWLIVGIPPLVIFADALQAAWESDKRKAILFSIIFSFFFAPSVWLLLFNRFVNWAMDKGNQWANRWEHDFE